MKKFICSLFTIASVFIISNNTCHAIQFDVLVLPTEISQVCDNYFCFPEPSDVAANYVIAQLNKTKNINVLKLDTIRERLAGNPDLKLQTENMLKLYEQTERLDFATLKNLSNEFGVKSIIVISCYAITDRAETRRNLWEVLELASAFKITYPFSLITTAVLVDTDNSIVMWSGKFDKTVSDSNGYYLALNQAQANSHLEKLRQYFKNFVAPSISQNVHLRFFPREVRNFNVIKKNESEEATPKFMPNALDHLINPAQRQEIEGESTYLDSTEELIFDF